MGELPWVQGHPGYNNVSQSSLSYDLRHCLKKRRGKKKMEADETALQLRTGKSRPSSATNKNVRIAWATSDPLSPSKGQGGRDDTRLYRYFT